MPLSSKAIVLSVEKFGEADCYIRFLTQKWGVISALAKSARKSKRRYVGGLDLFCHDEIFLRGDPKDRPYLLELSVLNSFPLIRENLDRVMAGGKITQWVRKLADVPTPMPALYSLLGQTLALIEKESRPERLEALVLIFKLKLLSELGLKPRMEACSRCESDLGQFAIFDFSAGGMICKICASKFTALDSSYLEPLDRQFLDAADNLKLSTWERFDYPTDRIALLTKILTQFASFHTHTKLPL